MLLNRFLSLNKKTPILVVGVFLFIVVSAPHSYSQVQAPSKGDGNRPSNSTAILDSVSRPFQNPYREVSGNPFFAGDWKYGIMVLANNRVFRNMPLRLNLKDQQVHFRRPDNVEMTIIPGWVRQITLLDTVMGIPREIVFQTGFPAMDRQDDKSFYQVLSDGKLKFLLFNRKSVHVEKDFFSGDVNREFRSAETYYFYSGGSLERIHKNKEEILEFMEDQRKQLDDYLKAHPISFKSTADIKKLVDYYNSL